VEVREGGTTECSDCSAAFLTATVRAEGPGAAQGGLGQLRSVRERLAFLAQRMDSEETTAAVAAAPVEGYVAAGAIARVAPVLSPAPAPEAVSLPAPAPAPASSSSFNSTPARSPNEHPSDGELAAAGNSRDDTPAVHPASREITVDRLAGMV
jgi:hypothetical protein